MGSYGGRLRAEVFQHFLAPAGQPEMMHINFVHWHLHIFVVQRSCMKFIAHFAPVCS